MMSSRNRKVDAAIVSLLGLLPPDITELWRDTRDLSAFLRCGGITGITAERLSRTLSSASHRYTAATPWKCRLWRNTHYYLLGNRSEAFTPKAQFEHFQNPRHHLPTLCKDYFLVNTRVCGKFLEDIKMERQTKQGRQWLWRKYTLYSKKYRHYRFLLDCRGLSGRCVWTR